MSIRTDEFRWVGSIVGGWKQPLLMTHSRPDGDALGCLVAMRSILRGTGAQPIAVVFDPVPAKYAVLLEHEPLPLFGRDVREPDLKDVDGVIVMDTCTYNQIEPLAEWLRRSKCGKVAMDHHVTRDDLADEYVVDESASSACAILYEWAKACGSELDSMAVRALFIGIATDTGWFRFSNCDARALEIAADLVRRGVKPDVLYRRLYENESAARMRLFAAAVGSMELLHDERLAVLTITREMFEQTGTTSSDTEDLINEPMRMGSVRMAILLADSGDGKIKVSFRSKEGIDVAALAARFGGGGHPRAAGARIPGTLSEAKAKVIDAARVIQSNPQ